LSAELKEEQIENEEERFFGSRKTTATACAWDEIYLSYR
jgi:hypothetical protein